MVAAGVTLFFLGRGKAGGRTFPRVIPLIPGFRAPCRSSAPLSKCQRRAAGWRFLRHTTTVFIALSRFSWRILRQIAINCIFTNPKRPRNCPVARLRPKLLDQLGNLLALLRPRADVFFALAGERSGMSSATVGASLKAGPASEPAFPRPGPDRPFALPSFNCSAFSTRSAAIVSFPARSLTSNSRRA